MHSQFLESVERIFRVLAGLLMAALVVVTFADVVGRQFGHPLSASFELTQVAVAMMFYIALPFVTLRREHVTVDLIPLGEDRIVGRSLGFCVDFLSAVVVAIAALQLWEQAATLTRFNTVMMFLRWPIAPFVQAMAILTGLTAITCVVLAALRLTSSHAFRVGSAHQSKEGQACSS